MTSANAHDVLKDGGTVVYEPDTNTLKLKDASISSGANTGIGCYGSDDIIFDLKGTNTVSAPSASFAVQTTGHLTLIGADA